MKILTVIGTPHKGNTNAIVDLFLDEFQGSEVEKIVLPNDSISTDINNSDTLTIYKLYYSKLETMIDVDLNMLKRFLKQYYEIHASIKI